MAIAVLDPPFVVAARRTQRRLVLARGCRLLARSAWWTFGPALLAVFVWRLTGHSGSERLAAFALVVAWLAASALLAFLRWPEAFAALAAWDRAAGRQETFASAYAFEQAGEPATLGERLHVARARELLPEAARRLPGDLPVAFGTGVWLPPLLFLAFSLTGLFRPAVPVEEHALSADARARAAASAAELTRKAALTDPYKGLTKEERAKADELKLQLEQTAKKLAGLRKETPRDVLAELEKRAREAEKLAGALAGDELGGLSSDLISELERNADTADFGSALREDNLDKAAEEAQKLGARLGRKDLSLEERKRVEAALKRAVAAAGPKDKNSNLGRQLGRALTHLQANQPGQAGQQFSNLGQQLASAAQRRNAQNQLRQLAGSLRSAGQRILGGQMGPMQRLPQGGGAPGNNLQALGSMPLQMGPLSLNPSANGNASSIPFRMPGNLPPGAGSGQPPIPGIVPGTGAPPPGNGAFPMPGSGGPPGGQPGGMIPGGNGPGALAGGGGFPMPGGGGGTGGTQAGNGSASYDPFVTAPIAATKTGVVNAQASGHGPSDVRSVEGQQHGESAGRDAQKIAADFIKVEERSLSEEPLPLSRREQVLRYFTALRQQLAQPPASTGAPASKEP